MYTYSIMHGITAYYQYSLLKPYIQLTLCPPNLKMFYDSRGCTKYLTLFPVEIGPFHPGFFISLTSSSDHPMMCAAM
jgi:hypothetical protein